MAIKHRTTITAQNFHTFKSNLASDCARHLDGRTEMTSDDARAVMCKINEALDNAKTMAKVTKMQSERAAELLKEGGLDAVRDYAGVQEVVLYHRAMRWTDDRARSFPSVRASASRRYRSLANRIERIKSEFAEWLTRNGFAAEARD